MKKQFYIFTLFFIFLPSFAFGAMTQSTVTGSRALNTTYQNTSGYPIFFCATGFKTDSLQTTWWTKTGSASASDFTNTSDVPGTPWGSGGYEITLCSFVPENYYYLFAPSAGTATLARWVEWTLVSSSGGGSTSAVTEIAFASTSQPFEISNPNNDLFAGFVILYLTLLGFIYILRKK